MSSLRDMLTRSYSGSGEDQMVFDVTYVTERIISMSFPSEGNETTYRYNLKDVIKMLRMKHDDNYFIINVSDPRSDLSKLNPNVKEFGWPEHLAPPLERLCSLCKSMDSWLSSNPKHVVVVHCKGGKDRIASVIAAYIHYSSICASTDGTLDRFAMKRFYDDKMGGLPQPSQRRYINYFAGLLSGAIKINSNPLFMHHIVIHCVPNFDARGGCRPFIKVYQGMQPIFTSGIYNVSDNMQKVCISISPGIPLRGDILIKCYHKKAHSGHREVMWGCQFHTCAISDYNLVFSKQELDDAFNDPRFPEAGKVEFVFGPRSDAFVSVSGFKSDVTVPVDEGDDQLIRSDSFENFNKLTDGQFDKLISSSSQQKTQSSYQSSSKQYSSMNSNGIISSNYSSNVQTNGTSSLPRQTVKPLDETTQLDNLLQDLLNQQNYSTLSSSQKNTGSDAKTITTTTRTFTTYSPTDSQKSPDRVAIQRAEVSYRLPGTKEENHQLLISSNIEEADQKSSRIPKNAFTYTSNSPSYTSTSHREQSYTAATSPRDQSRSYQTLEREMKTDMKMKTQTLPYRTDYDKKHNDSYYHTLDGSHFASDKPDLESSNAWLQQQQHKLQSKRDHGEFRSLQERQLVSELKNAQNKYYSRRAQSESDELDFMDSYNGQFSPTSAPATYGPPRKAYSIDGFFPDSPENRQTFTSQTVTETRSFGSKNKQASQNESHDRLDELERTLMKASESIIASKTQQSISETHHFENRYNIKEQPAPKKISVIEEDTISLQPIGPGVQVLEPETGSTSTLNRPNTPGFPTSPVTPPFPVSPRTPYSNQGVADGHIISPTGTLRSDHHGSHGQGGQNVQYQTTHTQQYHTENISNVDGLVIDTNQHGSMLRGGVSPSQSSGLDHVGHIGQVGHGGQQLTSSHSMSNVSHSQGPFSMTGQSSPSVYFGLSRRGSLSSLTDLDMAHTTPKFVKDTSKYWYKPNITRDEAINLLKDKAPGTFVIRDSNSFPGAFGLALKVATLPANVQIKPSGDPQADLVRHFLIEPTPKGVRLRGCSNEPVFGSLAALVYQHSMTPLALPCKLALPDPGQVYSNSMQRNYSSVDQFGMEVNKDTVDAPSSASALLNRGAACNVIYINSVDTESLTGPQAVSKAIKLTNDNPPNHKTTMVHFKVSNQGITLTDNQRKLFFRRHYPISAVTYCGMDPEDRKWKKDIDLPGAVSNARIFGFVARKQGGVSDNSCHLFAELDPEQPASAIVNFVTKIMIGQSKPKS